MEVAEPRLSDSSDAGLTTSCTVVLELPSPAVKVTGVIVVTCPMVIWIAESVIARPAPTNTDAGTVTAAGSLLLNNTFAPPAGATGDSCKLLASCRTRFHH